MGSVAIAAWMPNSKTYTQCKSPKHRSREMMYNLSHFTLRLRHTTHERGFKVRPCASTRRLVGTSPSRTSSSDLGAFSDGVCVEGGSPGRKSEGARKPAGLLEGVGATTSLADDSARVASATLFEFAVDMGLAGRESVVGMSVVQQVNVRVG